MVFGLTELSAAWPGLWAGAKTTVAITFLSIVGGCFIGTLLALARLSSIKALSWAATAYVNFFRSIPKLLTIIWLYYAFPLMYRWVTGSYVNFDTAFMAGVVAFLIFESAYFSEVVRAGIQSVAKGQMYAAKALGMTYAQSMRLVILPQAFRKMTPLLLQESIILFQDTTLVISIGLMDFFNAANVRGQLMGLLPQYIIFAGVVYFIVSSICSYGVKQIHKRMHV
ncbi:amino acid ABC transporter permease [Stenoxybacter acetivorans]|uniref:amino acid ABC transporter permease n=1 Tax=Stenoxybacter acetivorans TaxID=422441 RepID=UPI0005624E51|nr:amino acid ABC transporter permease [Stenoxybacter acetivorans]